MLRTSSEGEFLRGKCHNLAQGRSHRPQSHGFNILVPIGFSVISALPPRIKFSLAYFCDDIIPKIVEEMPFDLTKSPRKLMLHMYHATPHRPSLECLKTFRIRPIRHPSYSPDLTLYDCYFFGKLKGAFAGRALVSTEELLLAIRGPIGPSNGLSLNQFLTSRNGDCANASR
jgi:hypothetical protein